jgi:hypothetical protein
MHTSRSYWLVPFAALAALAAGSATGRASSIDDSAGRVVVPFVAVGDGLDTRVLVTNHEARDVKLQVRWVGERGGPAPGSSVCSTFIAPKGRLMAFQLGPQCPQLPTDPGVGMVVLLEMDPGVARFSARALVDVRPPMGVAMLQSVSVAGLPLGALDTTENVHVVSGLRTQMTGAPRAVTTDCYVGSFFDGSGAQGFVAKLTLVDSQGNPLGSLAFPLKPFELVAVPDVFARLGISGTLDGVQAQVVFTGKNDAALAYCVASQEFTQKNERTYVLSVGQVADPSDEVRKRAFMASSTPAGGPFLMLPPPLNRMQAHGVFVRHPDVVRCSVATDTPGAQLEIVAVSPDLQRISGGSPSRVEFATFAHGTVANGVNELWGLEIDWPAGSTPPPGSVPYRIGCTSGNGTSLADLLFF